MGDRSYMQITIYDCPAKRRRVGELLAGYVSLGGGHPREVAVGEQYTVEEISLGSLRELAGSLIELAPRCSFTGWQDPVGQGLGDLVAYCPRWGRFDGACTGSGDVVLGHHQVAAITEEAGRSGYLDRDSMLRLHAPDLAPHQIAGWQARPGLLEIIEVAYGIPWLRHAEAATVPRAKHRAWTAVIDRRYQEAAKARQALLDELTTRIGQLGLTGQAQTLRDTTPELQPDAARAAADACTEALKADDREMAARASGQVWGPSGDLPYKLRAWAEAAHEAHAGRRRP